MNGRVPTSPTCTVAEDAAGRVGILPACAARASQAARIAHQLSRRRAGRHSVRTGRLGGKGQRSMQCTVAG